MRTLEAASNSVVNVFVVMHVISQFYHSLRKVGKGSDPDEIFTLHVRITHSLEFSGLVNYNFSLAVATLNFTV